MQKAPTYISSSYLYFTDSGSLRRNDLVVLTEVDGKRPRIRWKDSVMNNILWRAYEYMGLQEGQWKDRSIWTLEAIDRARFVPYAADVNK